MRYGSRRVWPLVCMARLLVAVCGGTMWVAVRTFGAAAPSDPAQIVDRSPARHPELASVGGGLVVLWSGQPALVPATEPWVGKVIEWPLYAGLVTQVESPAVIAHPTELAVVTRAWPSHGRIAAGLFGAEGTLLYPRCPADLWQIAFRHFTARVEGGKLLLQLAPGLDAVLPNDFPDAKPTRSKDAIGPHRWQHRLFDTKPLRDLQRFDMARNPATKQYYLCGEDHRSGRIWLSVARDTTHWGPPRTIAPSGCFPAVGGFGKRVVLGYTRGSYQNLWRDDLWLSTGVPEFWPRAGAPMVRVSGDGGRTWDSPRAVVASADVISSRCTVSRDGTIWVAYEKSLTLRMKTELWLAHSADAGKTWRTPERITSGRFVDRDVDIAVTDEAVLVAFSRCQWPGSPSSIWLWQRPLPH